MPEDQGWTLKQCNFGPENGRSLAESITKDLEIGGTNSSYKDNTVACNFVIYDSKQIGVIAKGDCIEPGEAETQSST